MNSRMKYFYDKLIGVLANEDSKTSLIYYLEDKIINTFEWLSSVAKTDEEKEIVKDLEKRLILYYQRSLELNYNLIKQYKDTKDESIENFDYLALTVDKEGNPKKTFVIDVNNGTPIFDDDCETKYIYRKMRSAGYAIEDLNKWINQEGSLYEKLEAANKLTSIKLGSSYLPSPNYDMDGMTREQRDSQAWENYCIENGLYKIKNYDYILEDLVEDLKECIKFYEQAISIV